MPKQVVFTKRTGAYFPGANPTITDEDADRFLKLGVCVPYTDAARDKVKKLVADAEAKGGGVCEEVELPKSAHEPK